MDRTSGNEYTVPTGPLRGYDLTIDVIWHDVDAHEDRLLLDLWRPDTVTPGHTFETYRNGSLTYAAHRILVTVDTGSTLDRLAADLQLDRADLDRPGQYGQALHTLVARDLLAIDTAGRYTPTRQVDALLRPDDRAHATRQLRWFTDLLRAGRQPARDATAGADHAASPVARAFPELRLPDPTQPAPTTTTLPATGPDQVLSGALDEDVAVVRSEDGRAGECPAGGCRAGRWSPW